jgi:hypothetical protein
LCSLLFFPDRNVYISNKGKQKSVESYTNGERSKIREQGICSYRYTHEGDQRREKRSKKNPKSNSEKKGRKARPQDNSADQSITIPATAAEDKVTKIPVIKADGASLMISFARFGAMALITPTLIPREEMFPNPHRVYDAIKNPLLVSGSSEVSITLSAV